jgi:AcrR family transcriptional regulator
MCDVARTTVDTRAEIRVAALDLFAERGVDATSLREIAERIGITKAALYYHYASKDALLADLVDPMFVELRELGDELEGQDVDASDEAAVRAVVERFWELCLRNRQVIRLLITNARVVAQADIAPRMLHWRERVDAVLVGSDRAVDRVRTVVALGGLQDTVVVFDEADLLSIREAAIDAAVRALSPGS